MISETGQHMDVSKPAFFASSKQARQFTLQWIFIWSMEFQITKGSIKKIGGKDSIKIFAGD